MFSQGEVIRGIIDLIGGLADLLRQGVLGPSHTSAWGSQGAGAVPVSSISATSAGVDKGKSYLSQFSDTAMGEVYVCFEGPLGAHLKQEVKEKVWKGEYMEIFSLLSLECFNLGT